MFDGNISDPRLLSAVAGRIITVLLIITDRHKYLVFYLFLFTFSPVISHTGLATHHTSNFGTTESTNRVMQFDRQIEILALAFPRHYFLKKPNGIFDEIKMSRLA